MPWNVDWAPPSLSGFFRLESISALSNEDIWAVGNHSGPAMIAHKDSGGWSYIPYPPNLSHWELHGVLAHETNNAWAVGSLPYVPYPQQRTLIIHWDGTAWNPVWVELSKEPSQEVLYSVDGKQTKDIWAVGYVRDVHYASASLGAFHALLIHYDGMLWKVYEPHKLFNDCGMQGVSVLDSNDGWAVGWAVDPAGINPFILHWNGSYWKPIPYPVEINRPSTLWSVFGVSKTDVWAVGEYNHPQGESLIIHWDGSNWTRVPTPQINGRSTLQGVSFAAANNGWAVGTVFRGPHQYSLVFHWDGNSWKQQESPSPYAGAHLASVSAKTGTDPVACGFYYSTLFGYFNPLVIKSN
jgi:hypothetical protein